MNPAEKHSYYLEKLLSKLKIVDEIPSEIHWIMREGVCLRHHTTERTKLCDLIIGYYDFTASLIELKHSQHDNYHAIQQLKGGYDLIKSSFDQYKIKSAKIVYYDEPTYYYQPIDLSRLL